MQLVKLHVVYLSDKRDHPGTSDSQQQARDELLLPQLPWPLLLSQVIVRVRAKLQTPPVRRGLTIQVILTGTTHNTSAPNTCL